MVFVKVSPLRIVVRFSSVRNLASRFIGPFPTVERIGQMAYRVRVLEILAGVHDVLSKSKGSSNPHNVVKATFKALLDIRRPEEIARMRGVSLSKVFNG